MIQALAWLATVAGWVGAWAVGNGDRRGWLLACVAAGLWVVVDVSFGIAAGVASAGVAGLIAARNVRR